MNILLITFIIIVFSYLTMQLYVTKRVLLRTNVRVSLISAAVMSVFIFISFIRAMFQNRHSKEKMVKLAKLFLFAYPVPVLIIGEMISHEAAKQNASSLTINVRVKLPKIKISLIRNIFKKREEIYQTILTETGTV